MSNLKPVPRRSSPESIVGPHLGYKDKDKRKEYMRAYNSRPEWKEYKREYDKKYKSDPSRKEKDWSLFLKKEYGITIDYYNEMFEVQGGLCAICNLPASGTKTRLSVDHCHNTGKIRGLLCDKCNNGIGLLGDTKESLKRAFDYLNT